jgi:hypothetical protein
VTEEKPNVLESIKASECDVGQITSDTEEQILKEEKPSVLKSSQASES